MEVHEFLNMIARRDTFHLYFKIYEVTYDDNLVTVYMTCKTGTTLGWFCNNKFHMINHEGKQVEWDWWCLDFMFT
jgi:hypothetical protein